MSTIKLQKCLGEAPSVSKRALGENAAVALDLYAKSNEFIPLRNDLAVASPIAGSAQTLYRLERVAGGALNTAVGTASTWISTTARRSYVKGQISDDTTARTYYTTDDSDAAPRAINNAGIDKALGVPAPTTKPTVRLIASDEFTENEYYALVKFKVNEIADVMRKLAQSSTVGVFDGYQGYLDGRLDLNPIGQISNNLTGAVGTVGGILGTYQPDANVTYYDDGITVVGASVPANEAGEDPAYTAKVAAIHAVFYPLIATPAAAVAALIAVPYTYAEAFDALQQAYWTGDTPQVHNLHMFMQANYLTDGTYGKKLWPLSEVTDWFDWFEANNDTTYQGKVRPLDRTNHYNIWSAALQITGAQDAIDAGASVATAAPWRL